MHKISNCVYTTFPLVQLASIQSGINVKSEQLNVANGVRYITVKDIYENRYVNIGSAPSVNISDDDVIKFSIRKNDIIISKSSVKRDGIGYGSIVGDVEQETVFSGFTVRVRTNPALLVPTYLFYQLRSAKLRKWIIANSQASALTNLNSALIASIPIPTPPLTNKEK